MIALFNFNDYLGGGETIFTRWADYLQKSPEDFKLFYPAKSFIADELDRLGVGQEHLCPYDGDANYYYMSQKARRAFIEWIYSKLRGASNVKLVSFCMRELFTLIDVAKEDDSYTITHLILHDEDNLYVCQSLTDKALYKVKGIRRFSNKKQLAFNNQLFMELVNVGGLVAEKMTTKLVLAKYGISINEDIIVPPPMCVFPEEVPVVENNKKIIWLGRVVDFKLPAICAMLSYVCTHKDYSLTIIGDGEIDFLKKYMDDNSLTYENVNFMGVIPYDKIAEIIKQHSIGYACGTSIVEIGQHGLPVITALAAPSHILFKRPICGGIYNNKYKGNEGNNLFIGETEDEQPTIEEIILLIEQDFRGASKKSFMAMKEDFDMIPNFERYHKIIKSAKRIDVQALDVPFCSSIRRFLFQRSTN